MFLAVRDGKAGTANEVSRVVLGHDVSMLGPSRAYQFWDILANLQRSGLLNARTKTGSVDLSSFVRHRFDKRMDDVALSIPDTWGRMQQALGISLTELIKLTQRAMIVTPYLGPPSRPSSPADVFVLMPFQADLKPIYEDHISNVVRNLHLSVKRADDFFTANNVMTNVWEAINGARIIIADCTGRNPNVFYETGLAHVVGKPVILITQNNDDVPFDLRHIRYIHYDYTPRGMTAFENQLSSTVSEILRAEAGERVHQ